MQPLSVTGKAAPRPSTHVLAQQSQWVRVAPFIRRLAFPALTLQCLWLALLLLAHAAWLGASPSLLTGTWRVWDRRNLWPLPGVTLSHPVMAPLPQTGALAALAVIFIAATVAHLGAVGQARRLARAPRQVLPWIVGMTALMGLTLLLAPIQFSNDIYSYISYGHMGIWYHANALIAAPAQFPRDPVLPYVYWRQMPSVYGPSWLALADLLTLLAGRLGGGLDASVALFKLAGLAAHLANTILIWGILTAIAPRRRVLGTILYAWCPLPLIEFASSGHNDAQMLMLVLLGIWCWVRGYAGGAILAWAAALEAKYILLLVVPVWLWWLMAQTTVAANSWLARWWARVRVGIWYGSPLVLALVALFTPFWTGPHMFILLAQSPTMTRLINSPLDLLVRWVPWPLSAITKQEPILVRAAIQPIITHLLLLAFLALAGWAILRYARRDVLAAATWVLLDYVVLASGWFWPWYMTWPLVFVALRRWDRLSITVVLLAGGVLLIYPLLPDPASLLFGFRALVAFGPGLGFWLAATVWHATARRRATLAPAKAIVASPADATQAAE
jgi:hypothetical protein